MHSHTACSVSLMFVSLIWNRTTSTQRGKAFLFAMLATGFVAATAIVVGHPLSGIFNSVVSNFTMEDASTHMKRGDGHLLYGKPKCWIFTIHGDLNVRSQNLVKIDG